MNPRRIAKLGAFTTAVALALGGTALTAAPSVAATPRMMTVSLMNAETVAQFPARGFWLFGFSQGGSSVLQSSPAIPITMDPGLSSYATAQDTQFTVPAAGQTGPVVIPDGRCVDVSLLRYPLISGEHLTMETTPTSNALTDPKCLVFVSQPRGDGAISFETADPRYPDVRLYLGAGTSQSLLNLVSGPRIWVFPIVR